MKQAVFAEKHRHEQVEQVLRRIVLAHVRAHALYKIEIEPVHPVHPVRKHLSVRNQALVTNRFNQFNLFVPVRQPARALAWSAPKRNRSSAEPSRHWRHRQPARAPRSTQEARATESASTGLLGPFLTVVSGLTRFGRPPVGPSGQRLGRTDNSFGRVVIVAGARCVRLIGVSEGNQMSYTTKAAFLFKSTWKWVKWTHSESNSHAAIASKATELGANGYDLGQCDHFESARFPLSR